MIITSSESHGMNERKRFASSDDPDGEWQPPQVIGWFWRVGVSLAGCTLGIGMIHAGAQWMIADATKGTGPDRLGVSLPLFGVFMILHYLTAPLADWQQKHPWLGYLLAPLPYSAGFTAYRFPGVVIHFPMAILVHLIGLTLTFGADPIVHLFPFNLYFTCLLFALIGITVGRDLALFCHYQPLLFIGLIALIILAASNPHALIDGLDAFRDSIVLLTGNLPYLLTVELISLLAFTWYVRRNVASWQPESSA